jgi:hypothetical protein
MPLRIFCTLFLLISVCAFPVYFTLAIGIFSIVWFRNYYELIPLYFLNDVLYGTPLEKFFHISFVMTLLAVILVFGSNFVRKHLFSNA